MSGATDLGGGYADARVPARADPDRWINRLALFVMILTFIYVMQGLPDVDSTDTTQTDRVNPLNSWIWLGLLMMAMPILLRRWREVVRLVLSNWPLLVLFGYFALSITWALDPGASMRRFLFCMVQFLLLAILLSGIRRAPSVHVAIAAICTVGAVADLVAWVVAPGMAMTDEGFAGLQGQKNQTGLLLMYGCLAAAPCWFLLRRWVWKLAVIGATLLMAGLLVATRSTTSQSVVISAAFVMPLLLLIAKLPRRVILALAAGFALLLASAFFGYLVWCAWHGLDPMRPLRDVTVSSRTDIWALVIQEIQKRPFFGAGYSSFWSINPVVQPSLKTDQWFGVYAIINEGHNGYLDLLATGGVVGLIGGLLVLFRSIAFAGLAMTRSSPAAEAWRDGSLARPTAVFHLSLLLGLIVHNFTESNLFSNNGLLAVAFLLATLDLEKWRLAQRAHDQNVPAK